MIAICTVLVTIWHGEKSNRRSRSWIVSASCLALAHYSLHDANFIEVEYRKRQDQLVVVAVIIISLPSRLICTRAANRVTTTRIRERERNVGLN